MSSPPTAFSPTSSSPSAFTSSSVSSPEQQRTQTTTTRRKRVSAEHTLTRVRENQRRHRARRKDYIATLEERLAAAEQQLAEARAEIAVLRRERETGVVVLPCAHGDEGSGADAETNMRRDSIAEDEMERMDGVLGGKDDGEEVDLSGSALDAAAPTQLQLQPQLQLQRSPQLQLQLQQQLQLEQLQLQLQLQQPQDSPSTLYTLDLFPLPLPAPSLTLGPPPCCEDKPAEPASPSAPTDPECSTCKTRPAPLPTESTTLCAQAYVLISQQNFRDVDAATIRLWLYQGYRRAQRAGEGCRVENGALFRLLDYISGV